MARPSMAQAGGPYCGAMPPRPPVQYGGGAAEQSSYRGGGGQGGPTGPPATQGYTGGEPTFVVSSSQAAMMPLQPAYHGGVGGPTGPLVATQPSMAQQQQHGGLGSAAGEGAFVSGGAAGLYCGAAAGQGHHGRATMARPIGLADEEGDPLFELGGLISGEDSDDFGGVLR